MTTIRITIEVPDGAAVDVRTREPDDAELVNEEPPGERSGSTHPLEAKARRILAEDTREAAHAALIDTFIERCTTELGLRCYGPETGTRRYVNVKPSFKRPRVAYIYPRTARVGVFIDPKYAADFPTADVITNNDVPVRVGFYLHTSQAVDDAIKAMKIHLSGDTR